MTNRKEPYEDLANAIIIQAAKDYRKARRVLQKHPTHSGAMGTVKECEEFFLSQWFEELTNLSGAVLLRKLEEEFD